MISHAKGWKYLAGVALACLSCTAQAQSVWIGSSEKDPITDKQNSLAFIGAIDGSADLGVRCRNDELMMFVTFRDAALRVGDAVSVTVRTGIADPSTVGGVVVSHSMIGFRPEPPVFIAIRDGEQVAVRFSDRSNSRFTHQFRTVLKPNSLALVGRALADCNIAPFPQTELDAAVKALSGGSSVTSKKGR